MSTGGGPASAVHAAPRAADGGGEPMLEVEDLTAGYGATLVLQGLTLQAGAGRVTALLGANGAGKSTLMKALAGLLPAAAGRLRFLGEDITRHPPHQRVLQGLVMVPEGRWVFPSLTVAENLRLGAINPRARPAWQRSRDHVYHVFPRLLERERQAAATLSGGEQQMLAIGRGLMSQPKMMLLDEPTLGLAPLVAHQMFELVGRLVEDGLTLLLAEQDVRRTLSVADAAYVVENGHVAIAGEAAALADDPRIRQAYLGL